MQAFSAACWQRIEGHHDGRRGVPQWPSLGAFHSNWPLLAVDLLVGAWKISAAAADSSLLEADLDVLDPPPAPVLDWHDTYAAELARLPAIAKALDLAQGDGIEIVFERANLRPAERRVMRGWLYGSDLAQVADDLGERPHTVATLFRHAVARLQWLGRPKDAWRYASVNTPERFGWVRRSSPQAPPEAELAQDPAGEALGIPRREGLEVVDAAGVAE